MPLRWLCASSVSISTAVAGGQAAAACWIAVFVIGVILVALQGPVRLQRIGTGRLRGCSYGYCLPAARMAARFFPKIRWPAVSVSV